MSDPQTNICIKYAYVARLINCIWTYMKIYLLSASYMYMYLRMHMYRCKFLILIYIYIYAYIYIYTYIQYIVYMQMQGMLMCMIANASEYVQYMHSLLCIPYCVWCYMWFALHDVILLYVYTYVLRIVCMMQIDLCTWKNWSATAGNLYVSVSGDCTAHKNVRIHVRASVRECHKRI